MFCRRYAGQFVAILRSTQVQIPLEPVHITLRLFLIVMHIGNAKMASLKWAIDILLTCVSYIFDASHETINLIKYVLSLQKYTLFAL